MFVLQKTQRPDPWDEVKVTDELPPACPQTPDMTYVNLHSKGFNKEDEDCLYINVFVPLVITSVADTCRPASNCIENSSLWKKDIYALNHYFLKERPHLSKNDDAMLIMTVFNLYSLLAITIFFLKTSALFYEQRAINRWSTGTVHKYLFFQKELFSVTGRSACVKQGSDIWWFGPLCYA